MSGSGSPSRILRSKVSLRRIIQDLSVGGYERRLVMARRCDDHPIGRIGMKVAGQTDGIKGDWRQKICDFYAMQADDSVDPRTDILAESQALLLDEHGYFP